jgi:hypothetical protein
MKRHVLSVTASAERSRLVNSRGEPSQPVDSCRGGRSIRVVGRSKNAEHADKQLTVLALIRDRTNCVSANRHRTFRATPSRSRPSTVIRTRDVRTVLEALLPNAD